MAIFVARVWRASSDTTRAEALTYGGSFQKEYDNAASAVSGMASAIQHEWPNEEGDIVRGEVAWYFEEVGGAHTHVCRFNSDGDTY